MANNICLNGEWDFMPIYNVRACLDLPQKLVFEEEKICVPSSWRYIALEDTPYYKSGFGVIDDFEPFNTFEYPMEWSKADTGVYHRTFEVPDEWMGGRVFLKFNGIIQTARILVNGKEAASWDEAYLPLKADITDFINTDNMINDLTVVVSTFENTVIQSGKQKTLGLSGSWFGNLGRGIWEDVMLESCPNTYIDGVFVKTSFRENKIAIETSFVNRDKNDRILCVKASICDTSGIVKTIELGKIQIKADSCGTISSEEAWYDAHLWMPDDPHLYSMKVAAYENGSELNSKTIKFGFREVWSEKHKFIINGVRINLRGDSWHFQGSVQQSKQYALNWYKLCKDNGLNFVRLHAEPYPEYYLEAADEAGMLIVDETAIYGSTKSMDAGNHKYIDMCKRHIERFVMRDRNHPSVVLWSLQNEMRWVDGRDIFKLHIPEMMRLIHKLDGSRAIILEGDNRLLAKEKSEIESYHYNIDGTIEQWDKKRPLIFGEHGGWWYICPQNSSAYVGLSAYAGCDAATKGVALKEKLYVEYCRKAEVTGITSFNFAYYMQKAMPEKDIRLMWEELDTPSCKPKVIKKYSMTINNGLLKDYPIYTPNISQRVLHDAYKDVTILSDEYNSSFFDEKDVERNFSIFNDTLHQHNCLVDLCLTEKDGNIVQKEVFSFTQQPGEMQKLKVDLRIPKVKFPSEIILKLVLYHENTEMHRLEKIYKIYPSSIKTSNIDTKGKRIAIWGRDDSFEIVKRIVPICTRISDLKRISIDKFDIVVIGNYIDANANEYMSDIISFVQGGGVVIQLEQFKFVPGNLNLFKQSFFSTHINDASHKILENFTDEDFIFWKPSTKEEVPQSIIERGFVKPVKGNVNILLECSAGDFGDGGDLWASLIEYKDKKGTMLLNQLELVSNYYTVPQACKLLRNLIEYAIDFVRKKEAKTAFLATAESSYTYFLTKIGAEFDVIDFNSNFNTYNLIVVDIAAVDSDSLTKLTSFVKNGGRLLVFPAEKRYEATLNKLVDCKVIIKEIPTYLVQRNCMSHETNGISITDTSGFDKVYLTPRLVENLHIGENSIEVEGGINLLVSVTGEPWYDYYVRGFDAEFSRIALVEINKEKKVEALPYMVVKKLGEGSIIISQLAANAENDKNVRVYSKLLSNLGAYIKADIFTSQKSEKDYAVDYFMALPFEDYNDYYKEEEYFSDKEFSLNNLGEGLYGWMKKIEKEPKEGFINVIESAGRKYFFTCFAEYVKDTNINTARPETLKCRIKFDTNSSFKLWVNGKLLMDKNKFSTDMEHIIVKDAVLSKGLNSLVMVVNSSGDDIRFRPVFENIDGTYIDSLKYQLTIDEVDPK